jgi:LPXTG-site transpeptidase (sortase) family protein
MKRRLIALGIVSPILLVSICAAALLLAGISVLLFLGRQEQSRIVRIIPLAPLSFYEAAPPTSTPAQSAEVAVTEVSPDSAAPVEAQAVAPPPADQATTNPNVALTSEEVNDALGFNLPPGSVNSISQEGVATRVVIPKLNMDRPVVLSPIENQTWKVDHLDQLVGHLEGTAAPGSNSNLVLAAHVTLTTGVYGPFAGLAQLAPGDEIYVYSGADIFEYVVDGYQTVERTAVDVTYPTDTGQVTLITCNNWNSVEERYEQRLVVRGHLVSG